MKNLKKDSEEQPILFHEHPIIYLVLKVTNLLSPPDKANAPDSPNIPVRKRGISWGDADGGDIQKEKFLPSKIEIWDEFVANTPASLLPNVLNELQNKLSTVPSPKTNILQSINHIADALKETYEGQKTLYHIVENWPQSPNKMSQTKNTMHNAKEIIEEVTNDNEDYGFFADIDQNTPNTSPQLSHCRKSQPTDKNTTSRS